MGWLANLFGRGRAPPPQGRRETLSLIVLSNTVDLTVEKLLGVLDELYPAQFLPPRQDNFVIDGAVPGATFFIQCTVPGVRGTFMLHSVPGPYTEMSDFAVHIADLALRKRAESQACWMSIDLRARHRTADEAEPYRLIGALLAKLAPADAAFVVDLATSASQVCRGRPGGRLARGERIFGPP